MTSFAYRSWSAASDLRSSLHRVRPHVASSFLICGHHFSTRLTSSRFFSLPSTSSQLLRSPLNSRQLSSFFQLFSTRFNYLRSVHLASTLVNLSELFSLLLNSHQLISSLFSFCHLFSTLFTSTQFVSTMSDLSTSPQLSSTSLNFFHFF